MKAQIELDSKLDPPAFTSLDAVTGAVWLDLSKPANIHRLEICFEGNC